MGFDISVYAVSKLSREELAHVKARFTTRRQLLSDCPEGMAVICNSQYFDDDGKPYPLYDDLTPFLSKIQVLGGYYKTDALKADYNIPQNAVMTWDTIAYHDDDVELERPVCKYRFVFRKDGQNIDDGSVFDEGGIGMTEISVPLEVSDEKYICLKPEPAFIYKRRELLYWSGRRDIHSAVCKIAGLEDYDRNLMLRMSPEMIAAVSRFVNAIGASSVNKDEALFYHSY